MTLKRMVRMIARIGTAVLVVALVFSCATVPLLRDESSSNVMRVPFVRVLLDESQTEVTIGADRQFAIECL
ncbi:MAG: hypothetical protein KAW46_05800, partial [candidate division Zixibacteria bacterium]|nr:hypothetical protein [candidate division Zixibacteria bacterium]